MLFRNRGGVAVRINRVAALFQRRILMGKEAFDFFPLDVHLSDKMELIAVSYTHLDVYKRQRLQCYIL